MYIPIKPVEFVDSSGKHWVALFKSALTGELRWYPASR